jgi:hypothetical protein
MNHEPNTWSEGLQQQTREAIGEMRINPDGKLHFKNHDTRGAFIQAHDLVCGKLSLTDKENGQVSEFADIDKLLSAGWAID